MFERDKAIALRRWTVEDAASRDADLALPEADRTARLAFLRSL